MGFGNVIQHTESRKAVIILASSGRSEYTRCVFEKACDNLRAVALRPAAREALRRAMVVKPPPNWKNALQPATAKPSHGKR
jgi:hypothetical protein